MDQSSAVLVCFAVKEEAQFFDLSLIAGGGNKLITGMGMRNAGESIRRALDTSRPRMVITAGFAGGLNPKLARGTVVYDADEEMELAARLKESGAVPVRFHCADRVAVTAAEKAALWKSTGADAVEMESQVIRMLCQERNIPSATVRVISDAADEDLPLDFNTLMTADDRIGFARLAWAVAKSPGKIGALIKFQKQTQAAAHALARVLHQSLGGGRK